MSLWKLIWPGLANNQKQMWVGSHSISKWSSSTSSIVKRQQQLHFPLILWEIHLVTAILCEVLNNMLHFTFSVAPPTFLGLSLTGISSTCFKLESPSSRLMFLNISSTGTTDGTPTISGNVPENHHFVPSFFLVEDVPKCGIKRGQIRIKLSSPSLWIALWAARQRRGR